MGKLQQLEWRFIAKAVTRVLLPLWFLLVSGSTFVQLASHDLLGIDARIYRFAAVQLLSGGNPWTTRYDGVAFAGPPPTLLMYLPWSIVPEPAAVLIIILLSVAAGAWAIHRLRLPMWWLLFPPLFEAIIVGNPDAWILALLLVRNPLAGLAAGFKVYAVIPLVLQRRWPAVAVSVVIAGSSLVLIPQFLTMAGSVVSSLDDQAAHLSAWGTWFVLPTILALFALRRRGAEWLVVPALWPATQRHYAAMSLPAVSRSAIGAAIISTNLSLAPAVAVVVMAIEDAWNERRRAATDQSVVNPVSLAPADSNLTS